MISVSGGSPYECPSKERERREGCLAYTKTIRVWFLTCILLQCFNSVLLDQLYGNNGSDLIFGDFGKIEFNILAPSLYKMNSIISLNCTKSAGVNIGGGTNSIEG